MPTLKIDLTADSRKLEGQMQSAGRTAAAKFSSTFDANSKVGQSLLKRLTAAGNNAGRALAEAFGVAGVTAGKEFGKQFKKGGGFGSGLLGGIVGGGVGANMSINSGQLFKAITTIATMPAPMLMVASALGLKNWASRQFGSKVPPIIPSNVIPVNFGGGGGGGGGGASAATGAGFAKVLGSSVAALGLGAAFGKLIRSSIELALSFDKMSKQTGYSVESLNTFQIIARDIGSTLEDVLAMASGATGARTAALEGDPMSVMMTAFQRLGISREALQQSSNPLELLAKTAPQGTAANVELGKIIGPTQVAAFRAMQESMADMAATAAKLKAEGRLIPPESVAALKEVKDEFEDLYQIFQTEMMPILATIGKGAVDAIYWVKDLMDVVASWIYGIGDVLGAVGGYITSLIELYKQMFIQIWDFTKSGVAMIIEILKNPAALIKNPIQTLTKIFAEKGPTVNEDFIKAGENTLNAAKGIIKSITDIEDNAAEGIAKRDQDRMDRQIKRQKQADAKKTVGTSLQPPNMDEARKSWMQSAMRMPSDEHVSIGNFLGQGTSLSSIGQKQLEVQQQSLSALLTIAELNRQMNAMAAQNPLVGIPQ